LCDGIHERHNILFDIDGKIPRNCLDEATTTIAFKAVRELLFNVAKHADAKTGRVNLTCEDGLARISVSDSGGGFSKAPSGEISGNGDGFGLFNIQERLHDMGGRMHIHSKAGEDTCVTIWLPVSDTQNGTTTVGLGTQGDNS
jgi:signal transduction histidine kinase